MKFNNYAYLIQYLRGLCAKNDKKLKGVNWCVNDFYVDLCNMTLALAKKKTFKIMLRESGFEVRDDRIQAFKKIYGTDLKCYKCYQITFNRGCYHLIRE